jgi:hypothetical protein
MPKAGELNFVDFASFLQRLLPRHRSRPTSSPVCITSKNIQAAEFALPDSRHWLTEERFGMSTILGMLATSSS